MQNDDEQVGRILSRREAIILFGAAGASLIAGCSSSQSANAASSGTPPVDNAMATNATASGAVPGCVVRPAQTKGPYFVDEKLNRSDIRSDPSDGSIKGGVPLDVTFNVTRLAGGGCAALAGAIVDVWHCDATGIYSDVRDPSFDTTGKKYLRGYQVTDASGRATFRTIYPGWYEGRTVHIHFTVRTNPGSTAAHEFTSQIYFDDAVNDKVFSQAPYSSKRQMKNEGDAIFRDNGSQLILSVKPVVNGYAGTFDIALQIA